MREYLVWLAVIALSFYAYTDWRKGLFFLILLMAVLERPDMPKGVSGIPGLNPWNLLFINVLVAAYFKIGKEASNIQASSRLRFIAIYYIVYIFIAYLRQIGDMEGELVYRVMMGMKPPTFSSMLIDDLFNPIKFLLPAFLAYYACDNEKNLKLFIYSMLVANFLIALQIINIMPVSSLTGGYEMQKRAIDKIDNRLGYFRSDASVFLAGAAWGVFALRELTAKRTFQLASMAAMCVIAFSIALTGGRSGQGALLLVGAILAWFKWRKLFLLAPVGLIALVAFVPSVQDRFTQGFQYDPNDPHFAESGSVAEGQANSVTSGRTVIWPYVIDKIEDSPFLGYGKNAMRRLGISTRLWVELNEGFPHPHNAYLELFLDGGIILGMPLLLLYLICLRRSFTLMKIKDDKTASFVGVVSFSMIFSFMIGSMAQQSFYPGSSTVILLCAMGIMARIYREKYVNNVKNLSTDSSGSWNVVVQKRTRRG